MNCLVLINQGFDNWSTVAVIAITSQIRVKGSLFTRVMHNATIKGRTFALLMRDSDFGTTPLIRGPRRSKACQTIILILSASTRSSLFNFTFSDRETLYRSGSRSFAIEYLYQVKDLSTSSSKTCSNRYKIQCKCTPNTAK